MRSSKRFTKAGFTAVLAVAVLALAVFSAGCIGTENPDEISGTISVAGSTTVLPVAQAVAEVYMNDHQSADIQISGRRLRCWCNLGLFRNRGHRYAVP